MNERVHTAWQEGRRQWEAQRWDDAVAAFRVALACDPSHAAAQFDLAAALLCRGNAEEGTTAAIRAARLVPSAAAVHARVGSLQFSRGRYEEARASMRRSVALDPGVSDAYFYLGACAYNEGAYDLAATPFARAACAAPENAELRYRWGISLFRAGDSDKAAAALSQAVALQPNWGEAHYHLGLALMRRSVSPPTTAERPPPYLVGERVVVSLTGPNDAFGLCEFHRRNRDHLRSWHPGHPDDRESPQHWQEWAETSLRLFSGGHALRLVVRLKEHAGKPDIIGEINCRMEPGAVEACTIGYHIDAAWQGAGLMHEALVLILDYLFGQFSVRRVMAHHDPENRRSAGLLRRIGFREVGRFPAYLKVGDEWRDQVVVDLLAPDLRSATSP